MIKCIAIDDEPLALKQLESYIGKIGDLHLIGSFQSGFEAIEFLQSEDVDLMFVDINMPDLSGMEMVKSLSHPPKIIFTTAYREYAAEGFLVDAADYLIKPISFSSFNKSVEKVKHRYFSTESTTLDINSLEEFLFVKTTQRIVRININDITYIEGMRDYVRIHMDNEESLMTLITMKTMINQLPSSSFMKVHRSFIVNLNKVNTIERNRIIFGKNTYVPISDAYKEDFRRFIEINFLK